MSDGTHNLDVEHHVLAQVLWHAEPMKAWAAVTEALTTPLMLFGRDNRIIALAMFDQWAAGAAVDVLSVRTALQQVSFNEVMDKIAALKNEKPGPLHRDPHISPSDSAWLGINGPSHPSFGLSGTTKRQLELLQKDAHVIKEHYEQRQAIDALRNSLNVLEGPSGRTRLRSVVDGTINGLARLLGSGHGSITVGRAAHQLIAAHDRAKREAVDSRPTAKWPMGEMESICKFKRGALVVLAAPSGCGKTSLALATAVATAQADPAALTVAMVSREMSASELTGIIAARACNVRPDDIEMGRLTENQRADMVDWANRMEAASSIIIQEQTGKLTHNEITSWTRQQHVRSGGKLRLLIVDHLGLLDGENPRQMEYERTTAATRALKVLAMELGITVLALCQLNRQSQKVDHPGKRMEAQYGTGPMDFELSALKGSGSIENDADQVVFICPQMDRKTAVLPVKLKVAKNRWGREGEIACVFDKPNGQQFRMAKSNRAERTERPPDEMEDLFDSLDTDV